MVTRSVFGEETLAGGRVVGVSNVRQDSRGTTVVGMDHDAYTNFVGGAFHSDSNHCAVCCARERDCSSVRCPALCQRSLQEGQQNHVCFISGVIDWPHRGSSAVYPPGYTSLRVKAVFLHPQQVSLYSHRFRPFRLVLLLLLVVCWRGAWIVFFLFLFLFYLALCAVFFPLFFRLFFFPSPTPWLPQSTFLTLLAFSSRPMDL